MRDIKLRFWDKENKSMVYQNKESLFPLSYYKIVCDCFTDFEFRLFKLKNNTMNFEEVESVKMQYTGLIDINGKEIYEGDILRHFKRHKDKLLKIEVSPSYGVYAQENYNTKILIGKSNTHLYFEVIGNIYENSELLEEKR
jgi:uncharacterized phage protein (TIGR01671 family)